MSKAVYTGIDGKARKVPRLYVGVDGKARKVKFGYVGVNGIARLFYTASKPVPEGYDRVEYIQFINGQTDAVSAYFMLPLPVNPNTGVSYNSFNLSNIEFDWSYQSGRDLMDGKASSGNGIGGLYVSAHSGGVSVNGVRSSTSNTSESVSIGYDTTKRHILKIATTPSYVSQDKATISAEGKTNSKAIYFGSLRSICMMRSDDDKVAAQPCNAKIYGISV